MSRLSAGHAEEQLRHCEMELRRRESLLLQCYLLGTLFAALCVWLSTQLSRIGAFLMVVAFAYMAGKLCSARRSGRRAASAVSGPAHYLAWLHPRLALAHSPFFNVPFLVGANLFFMGLPLPVDPLVKASLDCTFLGATVVLFTAAFMVNRRLLRRSLPLFATEAAQAPVARPWPRAEIIGPDRGRGRL